jgi:hypothetical protein
MRLHPQVLKLMRMSIIMTRSHAMSTTLVPRPRFRLKAILWRDDVQTQGRENAQPQIVAAPVIDANRGPTEGRPHGDDEDGSACCYVDRV